LPRWKLPLGHFDIVRGEPLTIKFPARVLDPGLREDDRARFSLYFAEQRLRGNERRIVGILGIDFRIENGQRLERRYLDAARRTDERRFASDFQDPELVGVALSASRCPAQQWPPSAGESANQAHGLPSRGQ
jgi:hypothetical protein